MQFSWPLIGHQPIREYFARAFSTGKVHHAYLFQGPEQVGKSTFARMLAKTLLCGDPQNCPCGSCRACLAFDHGSHPDFISLIPEEEKEYISVEQCRKFISAFHTHPLLGRFRVGIIEEAERLLGPAANSLLKTLEEPGAAVVIFLVTSQDVLPTISSRCQRIRFGLIADADLQASIVGSLNPSLLLKMVGGRSGRVFQLKSDESLAKPEADFKEIQAVLKTDEGGKLLWITERFSRGHLLERREDCGRFLENLQGILRADLSERPRILPMLKRTLQAQEFLSANVDPRLICEFVLLNHHTPIS